ncbi:MAG: LruC domain-containing protein, partial [Bacteroidales bacterium]
MKKDRFLLPLVLTSAALILVLFSCEKISSLSSVSDSQDSIPTYFEFKTVEDYTLTVNLNHGVGRIGLTRFDIYDQYPFDQVDGLEVFNTKLHPVFTGITDDKGKYSGKIRLSTTVAKLYLYVKSAGVPDLLMVNINGDVVRFDVNVTSRVATKVDYSTVTLANGYALASWDADGVPGNIYTTDVISASLLQDINYTLPQGVDLRTSHPELLGSSVESNFVLTQNATVDIVFAHEGVSFRNTLGYYTYPTNNPPSSMSGVRKNIVFPNASYLSSGGGLTGGHRIHLKYWNGSAYQDTFPAGTTIAWFLVINGFNNTTKEVSNGLYTNFSDARFNVELSASLRQHMVMLYDNIRNFMLLAFEDVRRDNISCDHDFNDVIFYAVTSPSAAVQTANVGSILRGTDTDGDGVKDDNDQFPNDVSRAYLVHYPGYGLYGTLAFEDLWPSQGDYDMNDLVCDYNIIHYLNAQNLLVRIEGAIQVRASGANYRNGFAMQLGVTPEVVQSLIVTGGSVTNMTLDEKGLESGQSKANIIFFDDVYKLFDAPSGSFINTEMSQPLRSHKTITFALQFNTPQNPITVTAPPYNPYIIIKSGSGERV